MKTKTFSLATLGLFLTACGELPTDTDAHTQGATTMSLAGSEWTPEDMIGDENPPFIQFRAQGQLSGFAGCNNMTGSYEQEEDALRFGPIATTRKMCANGMETETYLLQALNDTVLADISHLKLELINGDGNVLMVLQRRDPD